MHTKTQEILKLFEELNKIPRRSKHEEKIASWLKAWASSRGFEAKSDALNNILIKVPATPGYEKAPVLILQGHMDMVCEKCKDSLHDFSRDEVKCIYDGDWLRGDGTTLGADNGIGIVISLTIANAGKKGELGHPPLELLFTVDEETGLTGARGLDPEFFEGRLLLNLDSEEEGVFIAGCAGGQNSSIRLPVNWQPFILKTEEFVCSKLTVEGLEGGHSGVEIHRQRANGIQLLARAYSGLNEKIGSEKLRLAWISGGSVHNAIPNSAEAIFVLEKDKTKEAEEVVSELLQNLKSEYLKTDPSLDLKLSVISNKMVSGKIKNSDSGHEAINIQVFPEETEEKLISLLLGLPHGVYRKSDTIPGLVETSNNLATLRMGENEIKVLSSQRSSNIAGMAEINSKIEAVARLAGAQINYEPGYPPWEPDLRSELLLRCRQVYKKTFETEPKVEVIHAGLECGIIGSKAPGMQMVSLGPTIKDPHCPSERVFSPSITKIWIFLENLLKSYC